VACLQRNVSADYLCGLHDGTACTTTTTCADFNYRLGAAYGFFDEQFAVMRIDADLPQAQV
jgi:hypothetical protein